MDILGYPSGSSNVPPPYPDFGAFTAHYVNISFELISGPPISRSPLSVSRGEENARLVGHLVYCLNVIGAQAGSGSAKRL